MTMAKMRRWALRTLMVVYGIFLSLRTSKLLLVLIVGGIKFGLLVCVLYKMYKIKSFFSGLVMFIWLFCPYNKVYASTSL